MASFQSLPNELLEVIVNNLPRQDLPHIRLTCSRLAQIATKPMFRKLVLGTSTESGKGFIEILASEELRTCVSQLTFNSFQVGQRVRSFLLLRRKLTLRTGLRAWRCYPTE